MENSFGQYKTVQKESKSIIITPFDSMYKLIAIQTNILCALS